jgi:hypothetical protein
MHKIQVPGSGINIPDPQHCIAEKKLTDFEKEEGIAEECCGFQIKNGLMFAAKHTL